MSGENIQRERLPLLVTGLPGLPGYNSFHYLRHRYGDGVIGLKPRHTRALDYGGVYAINAEDRADFQALFERYRFRTVIDASGCCALKSCEFNPQLAELINVDFGHRIAQQARQYGARLIRFSTDLVFDGGGSGQYCEEDPVCPITVYGQTMARAETAILAAHPEAVLLRLPLPMGPSLNGHAGAIDWIGHRFSHGNAATLYYDEIRSNIYIQDVLAVIEFFLRQEHSGIFHLGGPLPLSLYEIGQIVNKVGDYPPALLKGCWRRQAAPLPPRVGDVSMDMGKLYGLLPPGTIRAWPLAVDFRPTDRDWHLRRDQPVAEGAIGAELYGYNWDKEARHPLRWHGNPAYIDHTEDTGAN